MPSLRVSCFATVSLAILLMLYVAKVPGAFAAETFTLEQALALAYESNPRLEAERAQVRATDEEVAKALGGWRPNIGVSGSYGWTQNDLNTVALPIPNGHPRDVTVTVTQPLFTGTTIPQTRQANAQVRAARAQLTSIEQSVLQSAAQAYFNVVGDETALNYRRDNVQLLTDQLSMTQQRVNIGDVTVTDLQLVQARLSAAMADVSFSEAKLAASRAEFARAIGRPPESLEMTPRVPMQPEAIEQAVARALENNPDLNAAR
jgi:outer membrane protein